MTPERSLGAILGDALRASQPLPPITRAGLGELAALREMARAAQSMADARSGLHKLILLIEALTFFRLAAAHDEAEDVRGAVVVLGEIAATFRGMGEADFGDHFEGQGVLLAELAAENGNAEMADLVVNAASMIAPGAFAEAKRLRGLVE